MASEPCIQSLMELRETKIVGIDEAAVNQAAQYVINDKLRAEAYTPRTWRTHSLHIIPPDGPLTDAATLCLNWIFLISSLNFSFWSDKEDSARYGVRWRTEWGKNTYTVFTGYWSLVAVLNRALEEGIPITDPSFYSSEYMCPDSLLTHVFRPEPGREAIPLFEERVAVMRQVGAVLCKRHGGSFKVFIVNFQKTKTKGTALDLVKYVADNFPTFRDEVVFRGKRCYIWKRTQILVAEAWAAFYPPSAHNPHPLFPGTHGAEIHHLTMFADYRVPQILHHLSILTYPPSLITMLNEGRSLAPGCAEEVSIRTASICAVERVRKKMLSIRGNEDGEPPSSVLIDFYLWDLAKQVEAGEVKIDGITTQKMVPTHRTRSIWY